MHRVDPGIPSEPLVLVVDDDDDTRELYIETLAMLGFDTLDAADCEQARQQAYDSYPDVVVTDLTLRGDDGWQLIQDLKSDARTRDIPIVLLTGDAQSTSRDRAARAGCAAYIVKPCLPDDLAAQLRHVLNGTIHERLPTSR
jgi:two-component system, cell cycle response regulator DivK